MNQRLRRVPTRMCVICHNRHEKRDLLRFVVAEGGIVHDPTGKRDGRGTYVCRASNCRQKMVSTGILGKALGIVLSENDRQYLYEITA